MFASERNWQSGVDSYQPIDIGYLTNEESKTQQNIDI
jgi:hypothetical protein